MSRRTFLSYAVGMLAASPLLPQTAIMEREKAVVCSSGWTKCPNKHDTCYTINAPLVVGAGSYQNPDVAALNDKKVIECDVCHVLFIRA